VHGFKFASNISPLTLISAHGGIANAGGLRKCPMALRVWDDREI
jgi:hypothetical protein